MNHHELRSFTKTLNLNNDKKKFVFTIFNLHDVLDKILDRLNKSDFAFKRGDKARALNQPKGLASFYGQQDRAFNTALLNTAKGALGLTKKLRNAATPKIIRQLNDLLQNPSDFKEFHTSMLNAYVGMVVEDDTIDGVDSIWGAQALDYFLNLGHRDGVDALLDDFQYSLEQFVNSRKNLSKGRSIISKKDFPQIAPYFVGDDGEFQRSRGDLVHFWGFRWITVFKIVIRLVCYVIIICFFWEEEELVKEFKKIWKCKWIRPKDFNPAEIG